MSEPMPQRRVVCAANKYQSEDGELIFIGVRHFCPLMRQNIGKSIELVDRKTEVQGFVDQFGVFMDRRQALEVAKNSGQLNVHRIKSWPVGELFSEDLY
ncbi:hypothetical protein GMW39_00830 [Pectobacterium parmentieri]|uniref:hypothetical protein n=1 Tax=Pectobacterium parmentieri TaxID=1905730 RepID=UPI001373AA5F|nr:hypothetical protein [Pectobacterium parmentieri]QHQ14553.1 hypothetical protein GMW39_00830 [Pectobacterium parmentieri]